MVAVVADAHHVFVTRDAWDDFLKWLSKRLGTPIDEFHSRDFYRGQNEYRSMDGHTRKAVISKVLSWLRRRHHKVVFSVVDKKKFSALTASNVDIKTLPSYWCAGALHVTLQVQKAHQKLSKNKGKTILIFDREYREEKPFADLVYGPPVWTDSYYCAKAPRRQLDQVVDIPYFAASDHAPLIQIADLLAYLMRRYGDVSIDPKAKKYVGEKKDLDGWIKQIQQLFFASPKPYPKKPVTVAQTNFDQLAPQWAKDIGR